MREFVQHDVSDATSTTAQIGERSASLRHGQGFWAVHAWLPLLGLLLTIAVCALSEIDTRVADLFFFDASHMQWTGAVTWWASEAVVDGGRNVMRLVGGVAVALWVATFCWAGWRSRRRVLGYFVACLALSTLLIGGLKTLTNVDCPWDMARYGGTRPWVALFADRPDNLPAARCFPGAHSGSGFSLMCLYFVFLNRSRRRAVLGLSLGVLIGAMFSLAQQARGAHFLTHDVCSGFVVWLVCLALYIRFGRLTGPAANV